MKCSRWLTVLCLVTGCSASPDLNVGAEPDGSIAGSGGSSGFGGVGGFGGGDGALSSKFTEPPSEMAIDVLTLSCGDECKDVLVVASGGNAPYTFAWSDGVTSAARQICADQDASFNVTVTDTAFDDPEFSYEAQTVTSTLSANVLDCASDGGLCTDTNFAGTPESGRYVGPGTYVCTDGNMPVPMLTITLDFTVDRQSQAQSGHLYFQWGLAVIVAESDLTGTLECATGALDMVVENGTWGVPGPTPMSVVVTGTFVGDVVAMNTGTAGEIAGTFHWVSVNLDGSPSNDCLVSYTATRQP